MKEIACLLFLFFIGSNISLAGDFSSYTPSLGKALKKGKKPRARAISPEEILELEKVYQEKYEESLLNLTILVPGACKVYVKIYLPIKAHIEVFLSEKRFNKMDSYLLDKILEIAHNNVDLFKSMSPNEYDSLIVLIKGSVGLNKIAKRDISNRLGYVYFQ